MVVDKGFLGQAVEAFRKFIESWPDSDLRLNAECSIGMTLGGMGKNPQSVQVLQAFINDYPSQPLVGDARALISVLK